MPQTSDARLVEVLFENTTHLVEPMYRYNESRQYWVLRGEGGFKLTQSTRLRIPCFGEVSDAELIAAFVRYTNQFTKVQADVSRACNRLCHRGLRPATVIVHPNVLPYEWPVLKWWRFKMPVVVSDAVPPELGFCIAQPAQLGLWVQHLEQEGLAYNSRGVVAFKTRSEHLTCWDLL